MRHAGQICKNVVAVFTYHAPDDKTLSDGEEKAFVFDAPGKIWRSGTDRLGTDKGGASVLN